MLLALGNELHVCGDVGAGSSMKLINNALVACINAASIEALVAGRRAELALDLTMDVFKSTMAWNNALAIGLRNRRCAGASVPALRRGWRTRTWGWH